MASFGVNSPGRLLTCGKAHEQGSCGWQKHWFDMVARAATGSEGDPDATDGEEDLREKLVA